jgi:hypothetical protein
MVAVAIFLYGNGNANHQLGTYLLMHNGIRSAVRWAQFSRVRMLYITLRGHSCDIIVLNVHVPTSNKSDHTKDSIHKELEHVFNQFPNHHPETFLGDINAKVGRKIIFQNNKCE